MLKITQKLQMAKNLIDIGLDACKKEADLIKAEKAAREKPPEQSAEAPVPVSLPEPAYRIERSRRMDRSDR